MKKIILFAASLFSIVAQANIGLAMGTLAIGPCYVQSSNSKDFSKALRRMNGEAVTGYYLGRLLGELDPRVLGDGGILVIGNQDDGHIAIYEAGEDAPLVREIVGNANNDLNLIAVKKSCLKAVRTSSRQSSMIGDLMIEVLKLAPAKKYYEVK